MLFQYHIREMTVETSAEEFVTRFVHVEKFLPFCQQCGSYNTRWTCPPFDFDPMTIWQSYRDYGCMPASCRRMCRSSLWTWQWRR